MKTLKQFYRELQAWIDDGCPEHEVFREYYGLCANYYGLHGEFSREIGDSFQDAGLSRAFPFNQENSLHKEQIEGAVYKNPARLQWIKEHAK